MFGIGTNLVTCQAQPALGMVYKVCEFKGTPRIKISEEPGKSTIAGAKCVIRAIDNDNRPMYDIMCLRDECDEIMANPTGVTAVFDRITKQAAINDPFAAGGQFNHLELISTDLFIRGELAFEQQTLQ